MAQNIPMEKLKLKIDVMATYDVSLSDDQADLRRSISAIGNYYNNNNTFQYAGLTNMESVDLRFSNSKDDDHHTHAKRVMAFKLKFHGNASDENKKEFLVALENHYIDKTGLNKISSGYSLQNVKDNSVFWLYLVVESYAKSRWE